MSAISMTPPCKEIKLLQLDVIFIHAVYFCFQPVISNYCLCLTPGWQQQQKLNSTQTHLFIVCCVHITFLKMSVQHLPLLEMY